jgi:Protein of unknown function (DUF3309)
MAAWAQGGLLFRHEEQMPAPDGKEAGKPQSHTKGNIMLGTVLLVLVILMLFGAWPTWPHSRNWGYYPSGGLGLLLAILIVLLLLGRI